MFSKVVMGFVLAGLLALGGARSAQAQFAVIDVAAIGQLVQEVRQLEQQVQTAEAQLSQAQSEYAAITGGRGMQNLLAGVPRNYLPMTWPQVSQVLAGGGGAYSALSSQVQTLITTNAILTPTQIALLSPTQQAQLTAARQSPALLQAISRTALVNSSDRFASLQQLIAAIGGAVDQKASLDLTARITAEQGMLQNEQTKLEALYRVAESEERARLQRLREQAVVDQGSLRVLSPMGL
jgi:type IV secretion system protein VirB5